MLSRRAQPVSLPGSPLLLVPPFPFQAFRSADPLGQLRFGSLSLSRSGAACNLLVWLSKRRSQMCLEGQFWLGQVARGLLPCICAENGLQGESTAKQRPGGEDSLRLHGLPWVLYSGSAGSPITWERQGHLTQLESLALPGPFSLQHSGNNRAVPPSFCCTLSS